MAAEDNTLYPLLEQIESPADLRKLPQERLPEVCAELRRFLINSLSKNPGHFASSMGAVELTVALHYVFDTPYDRIVWDVGHQAYSHKILTGRRTRFDSNRKYGGLAPFPNPDESEYDTFTAGHASNSISAALGMAIASQLNNDEKRRNVVAVIGDASIAGGLAFEGINNAANTPNNLLIILNDNDMSIDRPTGSLNSYLSRITTSKSYNKARYRLYKGLKKLHLVSERRRGSILRFNNSLKSLISRQQNIFEGFNIRYFGPFDGHDITRIVRVLRDIKDMEGPRILHLRTIKGKGYEPAEQDPSIWHAPGKFNPETGDRDTASASTPQPPKFQDVFGHTLLELAREDNRVVGITAAMASGTSIAVMQEALPERTFDVGISEGHAVTFAGGLASEGLRPFCAIYSSFLQRGYDHLIHDVAIRHLPVTFCIDRAGLVGEDGVTHHGSYDLAYLRPIPGLTIASPRNEEWLRNLMYTALHRENPGPMAIRYPRGSGSMIDWHTPMRLIDVGRGQRVIDGNHVAVLTLGPIFSEAEKAVKLAREEGIDAALYDMVYLKPLDADLLSEIAAKGCNVITVEDGSRDGGLGTAVTEWFNANGHNAVTVTRIGIPDRFVAHGTVAQLRHECGMDADAILTAIKQSTTTHES